MILLPHIKEKRRFAWRQRLFLKCYIWIFNFYNWIITNLFINCNRQYNKKGRVLYLETAIDFSIIPNDLIRSLRKFNLTANQIELLFFIKSLSFRNSKELILSDTLRNKILDFFELSNWKHASKILNQLSKKGLIFIEQLKCSIKVIFSNVFNLRRGQTCLTIDKTVDTIDVEPCRNNILNKVLPFEKKEYNDRFLPSYIPEHKTENLEGTNFSANSISNNLNKTKNLKGNNAHSTQQPTLKCHSNDAKIDCKYISALTQQMKKYNYSIQDIELTEKLIFRAKNKGTTSERINDLAKALIYNRIDKSPKRKPINDLKAFIISSLFSKEEKHIFHKLENLQNFPFEPIKTKEDITIEIQREKEMKLKQLFEEEQKRRSQEQQEYETMKSALMEKLKDKYNKELNATKEKLAKINNWLKTPEIFAIEELYKTYFQLNSNKIHLAMNKTV